MAIAAQSVLFRFWGWSENAREVAMFGDRLKDAKKKDWGSLEW